MIVLYHLWSFSQYYIEQGKEIIIKEFNKILNDLKIKLSKENDQNVPPAITCSNDQVSNQNTFPKNNNPNKHIYIIINIFF